MLDLCLCRLFFVGFLFSNKLKEGYKVKITGHIKGKGNGATMEGNTPKQLSEDLVTVLPKGNSPRKVSVIGCRSSKCDNGNRSFVSNLQESLQSKGVTTIVKGYLGAISINDRGIVLKGDKVPAGKQMMEEGGGYQVFGKLFRGVAFHGGSVAFTFDMSGYFDFIAFF
jgi:hypothetical protein